jgi:DNA invertase Pin-like site-specific DNA recombinase
MTSAQTSAVVAKKAIPYSRFSGKRQEAGDSQRRQDTLAEQAAREEGVQLDRTITLNDKGISAFRGDNWKRGDLGKFLDLVDGGIIPRGSVLIIEQVNRLSRLPWMKQVQLWKEILERGIVIRTCVPPSRYTQDNVNDLSVGCPVVLFMMLANLESQQKSDWVREAWGQKKKRAEADGLPHGRHCPAWLTAVTAPHPKDPNRTVTLRYEINEERAGTVRRIYRLALDGWGACRIARLLNAEGVTPWVKPRKAKIPTWNTCAINYLLQAPEVYGQYQRTKRQNDGRYILDGKPVSGYYKPILDEKTWRAVQAARRRRLRRGGRPGKGGVERNLFTHLVTEAVSRRPMQCVACVNNHRVYHYLHTDPRGDGVPYPTFERSVLVVLAALKSCDVDGKHQANVLSLRAETLQAERSELDVDLKALEHQLDGLPARRWPEFAMANMARLKEQIAAKDAELVAAKEAADTSGRGDALVDLQTCLALLDEAIRLYPDRVPGLRARIKQRVAMLVDRIVVRVQPLNKCQRHVHVRLHLKGGEPRYWHFFCGKGKTTPLAPAWRFRADEDLGGSKELGGTVDAEPCRKLLAKKVAL